jgi:hypothetical protein
MRARIVSLSTLIVLGIIGFWLMHEDHTRPVLRTDARRIARQATGTPPLTPIDQALPTSRIAYAQLARPVLVGCLESDTGQPIAAADVCGVQSTLGQSRQCTKSDVNGRFELLVGQPVPHSIVASALGYLPAVGLAVSYFETSGACPVLQLRAGGAAISGSVLDATAGVVVGATVVGRALATGEVTAVAETNEMGEFSLHVARDLIEIEVTSDGYCSDEQTAYAPVAGLRFLLAPAARLVGRVLMETTQQPVAGMEVQVIALGPTHLRYPVARTDDEGKFEVSGVAAGGYRLDAVGVDLRGNIPRVDVGVGLTSEFIELHVGQASTLRGTVDVEGEPCINGTLKLSGPVSMQVSTDSSGAIEARGLTPGRYAVSLHCSRVAGPATDPKAQSVQAVGEDVLWVAQEPIVRSWSLVNTIPEASDTEVPHARLSVLVHGANARTAVWVQQGQQPPVAGARAGDRFAFDALPLGAYRVFDEASHASSFVRLEIAGALSEVRLHSALGEPIRGVVLDEQRLPLADSWVRAIPAGTGELEAVTSAVTDSGGNFVLDGLPDGIYELRAQTERGEARTGDVACGARNVELSVVEYGGLSGVVKSADGEPLPEFALTHWGPDESEPQTVQGHWGRWQLPWLGPGLHRLMATSGWGSASADVELGPGETLSLTLVVNHRAPTRVP